jgi:uncharacterized oxidoreductase
MKNTLSSGTILITGGASGIGLSLAERFLKEGSTVIICGRRKAKLQEIKDKYPQIHTYVCDVSQETQRIALLQWATKEFPGLNMLLNNAGIQRKIDLTKNEAWAETGQEIAVNLEAPIHLSQLFIPHLLKQKNPAIINVTSGLAFVPLSFVPVYCATKAALHSFTLSLRRQLSKTAIKVIEIIPPAVNTDLGGAGQHTFGVAVDEFADGIMTKLLKGDMEIGYGTAEKLRHASPEERQKIWEQMNA